MAPVGESVFMARDAQCLAVGRGVRTSGHLRNNMMRVPVARRQGFLAPAGMTTAKPGAFALPTRPFPDCIDDTLRERHKRSFLSLRLLGAAVFQS